ncbi:hypothetical protein [Parasitella parasitica]|nr:hypothetical protein [Parasitella parasitica]
MDTDEPATQEPAVPVINEPAQVRSDNAEISVIQYYSSRLMLRPTDAQPANQQMKQQRLNFIRFNQKALRAELYNGLTDALRLDDNNMRSIGKRVILPSSFIGGPRCMAQLFQDAMNLVRRFGKPDLFITFTCNPAWPEIANELLTHQRPSDRPDMCVRVFRLKLKALLDDIVKRSVLR